MIINDLSHVVTILLLSLLFIKTIIGQSHVVTHLYLRFLILYTSCQLFHKRPPVVTTFSSFIFNIINKYKDIKMYNTKYFNSDQMFHLNILVLCQSIDRLLGYYNETSDEWRMFLDMLKHISCLVLSLYLSMVSHGIATSPCSHFSCVTLYGNIHHST